MKYLTEEEERLIFKIDPTEWNNVITNLDFKLSPSEGRRKAWFLALDELSFVRSNMYKSFGKEQVRVHSNFECDVQSTPPRSSMSSTIEERLSLVDVVEIYFGKNSSLHRVFQYKLSWDYAKYVSFTATVINISTPFVHQRIAQS